MSNIDLGDDLDSDRYTLEIPTTDKDNPKLAPVIELRINETGRTQKRMSIWEITNPGNKYVFNLQKWKKINKSSPFQKKSEIEITGSDSDVLFQFLLEFEEIEDISSKTHLLTEKDPDLAEIFSQIISRVEEADPDSSQKILTRMVKGISEFGDRVDQISLSEKLLSGDQALRAEGMLQHARIQRGLKELETLVENNETEKEFQDHLDNHRWFFGSRYIDKHDRHILGKKEVDFALESLNGYLDIIELKRPQHTVVRYDDDHDMYFPASELTRATAQLQHYMREAQKLESHIVDDHEVRPLKPRGTVIIGAALDDDEREGLRIIESHLNNIELMTYTDLVDRGHQMLKFYEQGDEDGKE